MKIFCVHETSTLSTQRCTLQAKPEHRARPARGSASEIATRRMVVKGLTSSVNIGPGDMSSEHENSGDMSHPHVDPPSWVKKEDDAPSEHQHSGDMSHPHIDPTSSLKNEDDAPSKHAHSGDMSHPHIDRDVAFGIIRFVDDVRAFVVG